MPTDSTLSMNGSGKPALPADMQAEFEQMWHARPEDRGHLEDFRDSVIGPHYELPDQPNALSSALHAVGVPLSYAAGVARTAANAVESVNPVVTAARALLEGHAVGGGMDGNTYVTGGNKIPAFIPAPNVTPQDAVNALKGKATSGGDFLERSGVPEQYARTLGLGEEAALDPLSSEELPLRALPYIGKAIGGASDTMGYFGNKLYDAAFKGPLRTLERFHAKQPQEALQWLKNNRVGGDWTTLIPQGTTAMAAPGAERAAWSGVKFAPKIGTEGDMLSQINTALQPARDKAESLESTLMQQGMDEGYDPGEKVMEEFIGSRGANKGVDYAATRNSSDAAAQSFGGKGLENEATAWQRIEPEEYGEFKNNQQGLHAQAYPKGQNIPGATSRTAQYEQDLAKQLYTGRQGEFYGAANRVNPEAGLGDAIKNTNREISLGSSASDAIDQAYQHNHATDWLDLIPGGRELGTPVLSGAGMGMMDTARSGMPDALLRALNYDANVDPTNNPWRF